MSFRKKNEMSPNICQMKIYNAPLTISFDCDTFLNFILLLPFVMIAI